MIDRSEHAVLNHLIETCRDGERGLRLASTLVSEPGLKRLLVDIAERRAAFAAELLPHSQRLGGDAPAEQTRLGALHRGWIALEGKLLHNDQVVLTEVEQGNRATLDLYFDALNGMLPPETRDLVQRQFDELSKTHELLPALEKTEA